MRRGSNVTVGDAVRRKMPKEFDRVELKALQIGQGITAVMAKLISMTPRYLGSTRPGTGLPA